MIGNEHIDISTAYYVFDYQQLTHVAQSLLELTCFFKSMKCMADTNYRLQSFWHSSYIFAKFKKQCAYYG